jgi:uncharacterized peroxidase-related enzyme
MAFIETTPAVEADGEVREMYERQEAHYGYVPNYAKVFCHRPEILSLWAALLSGIRRPLDKRRFELVTVAAAHALRSTYCSLAHGKALTEFFSANQIQAIISDAATGPLSAVELAMTNLARKVARDASSVTAADVNALKKHGLTDGEIFDIVAAAAGRAFFSKLVEGLGADADAVYFDIEESLRESLTVGRPIDPTEPERLSEQAS